MTPTTGTLPVDAIIFDMDGVLVDSEPLHTRATTLLLADSGLAWDERESVDSIGLTDVESFAALVRQRGAPRLRPVGERLGVWGAISLPPFQ